MAGTNAFELQHSDLNRFLFADIGVEAGGMELSVMSALAREGIDPWQEAARLARLPWTVAVDELARLIAAMPESLWPLPVATVVATRLVHLLPRHNGPPHSPEPRGGVSWRRPWPNSRYGRKWLPLILLGLAVVAGSIIAVRWPARDAIVEHPAAPIPPSSGQK